MNIIIERGDKMSIMIYDDDVETLKVMEKTLESAGYEVVTSSDVIESVKIVEDSRDNIEVIVTKFDIDYFGITDYLYVLRKFNKDLKIVVIASTSNYNDELLSMDLNVDEYIKKPIATSVFAKRIERLLRHKSPVEEVLNIKRDLVEINLINGSVKNKDGLVHLSQKEYQVLVYLARRFNNVISREELYKNIWICNVDSSNYRTIDVHISNIRRKLGLNSLVSIRNMGYKIEN